jgi:hypothetical protein
MWETILKIAAFAPPQLLLVAGIIFLFISVAGEIMGKISSGTNGRIAAGVIGAVLLTTGLIMYSISKSLRSMSDFEPGISRYGNDYRDFVAEHQSKCRDICANEPQCVAFTFVKPGFQGPSGRCWLKQIPVQTSDPCCISGIKQ